MSGRSPSARRIVSLVPSLTEAVAELGAADRLVGVTDYCTHGVPQGVARIGGTKNPRVDEVVALRPDLVLANTEENRPAELTALREAGMDVLETFPRSVAEVPEMLHALAAALGEPTGAEPAAVALGAALRRAEQHRPTTPVSTLVLIWRKPWMGVGPDTFVDDLLRHCGFANALAGHADRYPRLDTTTVLRPELVLLPSEPYAFSEADLPALREWLGDVPHRFVDGRVLTWHGPSTTQALDDFTALAREIAADRGQSG